MVVSTVMSKPVEFEIGEFVIFDADVVVPSTDSVVDELLALVVSSLFEAGNVVASLEKAVVSLAFVASVVDSLVKVSLLLFSKVVNEVVESSSPSSLLVFCEELTVDVVVVL